MGDEQRPEAAEPTASAAAQASPEPLGTGNADVPAGSAAASAAAEEVANLEFTLASEVAYHASREAWFGGLQRATLFINVGLGAGLLADYLGPTTAGFFVAMASSLDVTFDFAGQARRHRDLRGRFMRLVEEVVDRRRDLISVRKAMLRLDADAPPSYRAVEAVAFNQALVGLGRDPDYRRFIPRTHRILRHVWAFGGAEYESLRDRRERLGAFARTGSSGGAERADVV